MKTTVMEKISNDFINFLVFQQVKMNCLLNQ
jgi:hypothetical protein